MKKIPYCVPEIIEKVLNTAMNVSDELFIHKKVLNTVIDKIASLEELGDSPYELMRICLRSANKALGATDPYEGKKEKFFEEVEEMATVLDEYSAGYDDSLEASVNIAAALNYEGLCSCLICGRSIEKRVKRLLSSQGIDSEDYQVFKRAVQKAQSILYIVDSAGEIAGDAKVIRMLSEKCSLTLAVAPHPILCRATREDAEHLGINEYAEIIDPGADMYGINLEKASSEFREIFKSSDVVIVKDGVNSRTLSNCARDYFILGAGYAPGDEEDSDAGSESTLIRKYLKYIQA